MLSFQVLELGQEYFNDKGTYKVFKIIIIIISMKVERTMLFYYN
jgi:hypothetical protein